MTESVKLRRDAAYGSPVVRPLPSRTRLLLLGEESDVTGYIKVRTLTEQEGWVFGEFLRPIEKSLLLTGGDAACRSACGMQRWAVKTATDKDVGEIGTQTVASTVSQLIKLPAPIHKPSNERVGEVERTVYRLQGQVVEWGSEDDGDLHMVLSETGNARRQMIIEV